MDSPIEIQNTSRALLSALLGVTALAAVTGSFDVLDKFGDAPFPSLTNDDMPPMRQTTPPPLPRVLSSSRRQRRWHLLPVPSSRGIHTHSGARLPAAAYRLPDPALCSRSGHAILT